MFLAVDGGDGTVFSVYRQHHTTAHYDAERLLRVVSSIMNVMAGFVLCKCPFLIMNVMAGIKQIRVYTLLGT
jgi:hypothetical protein